MKFRFYLWEQTWRVDSEKSRDYPDGVEGGPEVLSSIDSTPHEQLSSLGYIMVWSMISQEVAIRI